ncbi:MAG: class I lanthipeptide [Candidatus Aminicenantes bacterium]|nr:class I lanthipeptide [Candidatus Aminicenantes bacterium]
MKPKIKKKLQLSKTTITNLSDEKMSQIKAGYVSASCPGLGCQTDVGCTTGCPASYGPPQYCKLKDTAENSYCITCICMFTDTCNC